MGGLYSHTTRAVGTTLTANIYNTDHQNHIDNQIPTMMDDYSSNAAEMHSVADPHSGGSPSLATSLAGELERLRYRFKQQNITSEWEIFPDLVSKTAAYTASQDNKVILCDGTAGAFSVTLPAISGLSDKIFMFKKTDSTLVSAPIACSGALAGAGAGNVDDGTHSYKVTFVNAQGETEGGSTSNVVTVTDKSTDGKVALTSIPTGPASVTQRKIYRTIAGDTGSHKLVATIADNVTTTYTDNTADAGLGANVPTTSDATKPITIDGDGSETIDGALTFVLNSQYDFVIIVGGSTEWHLLGGRLTTHDHSDAASGGIVLETPSINTPTITVPVIADFTNSQHNHEDAASGGLSTSLGAWVSRSFGTAYQAATDGFVVAHLVGATDEMRGLTDGSNPPTTIRCKSEATEGSITMPVKAGDWWKVTKSAGAGAVFWIPLSWEN